MGKWKPDFKSVLIGYLVAILPLYDRFSKIHQNEEQSLAKDARITVVIDSAKTTDWKNPVADTLVTMPLKTSGWINERVSSLFEKGAIKVEASQVPAKKETTPKSELSR